VKPGNVIAEISIVPIGTGSTGLSEYVADCINILGKKPELKYQLTPMGTIIEGPLEKILETVKLMHEAPFHDGVLRVVTTVKIDDRRDKKASMESKVASVRGKLTGQG
jgi:uncharacterized protein (TIGR00106 family)